MKVIVCVLTDNPHTHHIKKLISCFQDETFIVRTYDMVPPPGSQRGENYKDSTPRILDTNRFFRYRLNYAIRDVARKYPHHYMLIVRDHNLSSSNSDTLATTINHAISLQNDNEWDILYLSAWWDRFEHHQHISDVPDHNIYIAKTAGPRGTSAFVISPAGRNKLTSTYIKQDVGKLLYHQIKNDKLTGMTVVPSPFMMDPRSTPNHYVLNPQHTDQINVEPTTINSIHVIWFIIIAMVVAFLVWVMITFNRPPPSDSY